MDVSEVSRGASAPAADRPLTVREPAAAGRPPATAEAGGGERRTGGDVTPGVGAEGASTGASVADPRKSPPGSRETPSPRLRVELTLGDSLVTFGDVAAVSPGPDGRLYVLDRTGREVTVWSPAGDRLGRFGGSGHGPGEFVNPTYLRALDDGRVFVGELMPPRLHWFTAEGEHLRSARLRIRPAGSGVTDPGADSAPGDGKPRSPLLDAAMAEWRVTGEGRVLARVAMLGRATAEGVPHGIHPVDSAGRAGPPLTSWREPGPGGPMPRLFGPRRSWAVRSDGAVWATPGDRYEVRLAGSEESGVRLLRRGTESPAVPPALREAAVERFLAELKGAGLPGLGFRAARDELEVADRLPAIGELWHSDVDGRLWVGIPGITPDGRHVRIVAFDVFGSDGTLRGRLRSPPGFELLEVRADRLYGLHVDGMDVERPRVLRLIR